MKSGATRLVTALLAVISTGVMVSACSSSNPEDVSIDLSIEERKLTRDSEVIKVKHNDTVTLRITADEHGSVHLHGYDLEISVSPDKTGILEFTADSTGRYPFTLHTGATHEEDGETDQHDNMEGHGDLFESPTLHTGDAFSFTVPVDQVKSPLLFHNHMNHEMKGEIKVSTAAQKTNSVQFEIEEDGSFKPHTVSVRPGTTIVWTNRGSKRARPTSGKPPVVEDDDHTHNKESRSEDEITLGTFEVHPR